MDLFGDPDTAPPDPEWEGVELPAALAFGVIGSAMIVDVVVELFVLGRSTPSWLVVALGVCTVTWPFAVLAYAILRKVRVETRWRPRYREHVLRLDPAGTTLDGRSAEVWLAGSRLVTGDGELYEVAETPADLRRLARLLGAGVATALDRHGASADVPAELLSMRGYP